MASGPGFRVSGLELRCSWCYGGIVLVHPKREEPSAFLYGILPASGYFSNT